MSAINALIVNYGTTRTMVTSSTQMQSDTRVHTAHVQMENSRKEWREATV